MNYNTIIFDLDGTLLNTLEDLADSVNFALEKMGYPLRSLEEIRQFVGNGVKVLINRAVPPKTSPERTEEVLSLFRDHYTNNLQNKTTPYHGIYDMLKSLKDAGINMAIVSNKYDSAVKALCRKYYADYIQVAIGESAGIAKKPAPDSVFEAMRQLGSSKDSTLYVGDSDVDVHTAHNAGLKCVGVAWGFRGREFLAKEGADIIIDEPQELLSFIQ